MTLFNIKYNENGEKTFIQSQKPHNLIDFVAPLMEGRSPDSKCKVVMLDSHFLTWLSEKVKWNNQNPEILLKYAFDYVNSVSDEDADKYLVNSGMNVSRYMVAIPILNLYPAPGNGSVKTNFRISQDACRKMETSYEQLFDGRFKFIIPGIVKKAQNIKSEQSDEIKWIDDILSIPPEKYKDLESTQNYDGINLPITVNFAPAIMEYRHTSASISMAEIYEEVINPLLDKSDGVMKPELSDIIEHCFPANASIAVGSPVLAGDADVFEQDILTDFYENITDRQQKPNFSMMS